LRDCLKTTGTKDWGHCVTCGKLYPYKKLQAGHFTSGRADAVLFEESGIHAQCYRCNIERSGDVLCNQSTDRQRLNDLSTALYQIKNSLISNYVTSILNLPPVYKDLRILHYETA